ncbi:MAG TPA: O-antigen ligase domain-containing protein, partial [Saprospiraceae bacterium]|nr:O-antigen ligase domain-containing protein [Saprospiraceae bacterium]
FGIMMAYNAIICLILAMGPFDIKHRIALVISAVVMILGMAYAGSRTPIVMIPLGISFFTLLSFNKRIMAGALIVFVIGSAFMLKSTSNPVIWRIQSAFNLKASADTMNVRMKNQKFIQPFIHSHPFGAGIGSSGEWGARFNPDSMLAGFAHDSAFVRVAVELGWIGLIIYMLMLFVIIKTGIYYSLRVRNQKIKYMYMAITTAIFMLIFASYPQEVISQLPNSIIFYILVAILVKLKDFDDPIEMLNEEKPTFRYPNNFKKKKKKNKPIDYWLNKE